MGFGSKSEPPPPPPPPPAPAVAPTVDVAKARVANQDAQNAAKGRAATMLTGAKGDMTAPSTSLKTLLGA
jgi:hypothetical protein